MRSIDKLRKGEKGWVESFEKNSIQMNNCFLSLLNVTFFE